jgi:hypothetical protein
MSVENTIQKLLEESKKIKQLDEANEVVPAHSGDEPSNKKNMKVDQKEAEGGTSKKANRATQGAVAPETIAKLESESYDDLTNEEIDQLDELSNSKLSSYLQKARKDRKNTEARQKRAEINLSGDGDTPANPRRMAGDDKYFDDERRSQNRTAGIKRATKKLESYDDLTNEEIDMSEDVSALFNGEEGLTEEFRQKAETIFEAAVTSRIKEEVARITEALEAQYETKLQEEIESTVEGLVEHVDGYLNLMVEQWMENNEVALESGMKSDILESFVGGLKNLFEQHYIEVPEEKFDLVGEMESEIETLNAKLDETVAKNVELHKALNESARESIVAEACEGLSDVEAEKLQTLAEEISFENSESFAQKMQTIRENYFVKKAAKVETPSILAEETIQEEKAVPASMQAYVKTISSLIR